MGKAATLSLSATTTVTAATTKAGPGGKHDNMRTYTPEEAKLVMELVAAHSPRWTHIAKLISDATGCERSAASVRNYYKRFCASKAIAERDSDIKKLNRCQMCGQIKRGHICRPASLTYVSPLTAERDAPAAPGDEPAAGLLALAVPPLAPASLEFSPSALGLSPLSTLGSAGPLSATHLFSAALGSPGFSAALGHSPMVLGPAPPAAARPFARPPAEPQYVVAPMEEDDDEAGEEYASLAKVAPAEVAQYVSPGPASPCDGQDPLELLPVADACHAPVHEPVAVHVAPACGVEPAGGVEPPPPLCEIVAVIHPAPPVAQPAA